VKSVRANANRTPGPNHTWFAAILGVLLGLSLVKFGTPVVLDRHVHRPETPLELVLNAWPLSWGFALAGIVLLIALVVFITRRRQFSTQLFARRLSPFFFSLPLLWYGWQWIAAMETAHQGLTRITMMHFTICIALFYVGWFCVAGISNLRPLFLGLLGGFILMLWAGFDQKFGGLEATRQMFYEATGPEHYPPEFLNRLASDRIFGTLFYPNALAGVILLLAPLLIWYVYDLTATRSNVVRGTSVGLLIYATVACLFWSQSKAGWLVAAVLVFFALLQLPISPRIRWSSATVIGLLALAVFVVRFSDYFAAGAASAAARIDYWNAAWATTLQNPFTGTGPGTFQIAYAALKRPESEMARLAHNDYLQQGSDGGLVEHGALHRVPRRFHCGTLSQSSIADAAIRHLAWLGRLVDAQRRGVWPVYSIHSLAGVHLAWLVMGSHVIGGSGH
jgi:hypothetical protein